MAVEASHGGNLLFPSRLIGNREVIGMEGIGDGCGFPMAAATEIVLPVFGGGETVPTRMPPAMNSGSTLTYAASRKRPSETANPVNGDFQGGLFSLLGEDLSLLFQLQQMEIDRLISQHVSLMRAEIEARRRRTTRLMAAAVEDTITKKLKAKEEEIDKIGKLNWALEERVKSLSFENQIWKDVAQTSEATANALRSNLQQILAQAHNDHGHNNNENTTDDAESSCGSNSGDGPSESGSLRRDRLCRSCRRQESSVLLLPCRHLSLCTVCSSTLHTCPVCNSVKTASVHVNLSGV